MKQTDTIKILYVDDETNNLIGFKASFRLDYKIFTASTIPEAYQHLSKHPDISIIFCDQRMPEKTGVQFFEEVRSNYPYAIRILLTGFADIDSVIDSINRGHIFRYVKKPWLDSDIRSAIEEAQRYYMANSMITLKNIELQKAYNELDKFAYSVTHDIRGPLLSIMGAIDVAQYVEDVGELKGMLKMMEDSVRHLDNYIQNMHDYYNLKRGELQMVEINFEEIVREQQDTFNLTATLNHIRFTTSVSQQEPLRSDKMTLKIILNNLLSNAFKYQQKAKSDKFVELDIKVAMGAAMITVKDNGIGIPKKHVPEIFNMFFRANNGEKGSGFGLYNVRDALLKLNGEISVSSEEGQGTEFKVIIPNK